MSVINRENAEHYTWGKGCDAWHLLSTRRLSVIEERIPPGGVESPHYHRYATQLFYLLKGEVSFALGTDSFVMAPGDSVHVLPGVIHKLENTGETEALMLVISSPESHSDRYEAHQRSRED